MTGGTELRHLFGQRERLCDPYQMGDLTKAQYVMRRRALKEEVERIDPPTDPYLDRARLLLDDLGGFWTTEPEPAERRKLLAELFQQVYRRDGQIVAVRLQPPFAPTSSSSGAQRRSGRPTQQAIRTAG